MALFRKELKKRKKSYEDNLKDEILDRKLQISVIEKKIKKLNKDVKTPTNPDNAIGGT